MEEIVGIRFRVARPLRCRGCTGGLIGASDRCPGSSGYFMEGAITYSNDAKCGPGVPAECCRSWAVSPNVPRRWHPGYAKIPARTTRSRSPDCRPRWRSEEKPVGTLYRLCGQRMVLNRLRSCCRAIVTLSMAGEPGCFGLFAVAVEIVRHI